MRLTHRLGIGIAVIVLLVVAVVSVNSQTTPAGVNNGSVLIVTGNTFQVALPASFQRRTLTLHNNNASDPCYADVTGVVPGGATTSTNLTNTTLAGTITMSAQKWSTEVLAGGSRNWSFPFIPTGPVVVTCASSSDSFYVDYQ